MRILKSRDISLLQVLYRNGEVRKTEYEVSNTRNYDIYYILEQEDPVGAILVDPMCRYFEFSFRFCEILLSWHLNDAKVLEDVILTILEHYRLMGSAYAVYDSDVRRDLYRPLFEELGFRDSIMKSPISRRNAVMIGRIEEIVRNFSKNKELALDIISDVC